MNHKHLPSNPARPRQRAGIRRKRAIRTGWRRSFSAYEAGTEGAAQSLGTLRRDVCAVQALPAGRGAHRAGGLTPRTRAHRGTAELSAFAARRTPEVP